MAEKHSFEWISVDNVTDIYPEEGSLCIVCMDCPNEPDWHLQITHWYLEGAKLNIVDKEGKDHTFNIKQNGFYLIQETSNNPKVFMAHGVKYWTTLPTPRIKPDETLTIE